jgi:hypothetical protein
MIDITLLFNKSNAFGIAKDVEGITRALHGKDYRIQYADPLEPPRKTDIAIHLEVPVHMWIPWAKTNVLVVNPEWFVAEAWLPYMPKFSTVIYKASAAAAAAVAAGYVKREQVQILSWGLYPKEGLCPKEGPVGQEAPPKGNKNNGFVWFLGASKNKRAYVQILLKDWQPSYPPLRIYTTEPLDLSGTTLPENVRIEVKDLPSSERETLSRFFRGHICCSQAEGFGYTAAEAEWVGAFTILNNLDCYTMDYGRMVGVHFIKDSETLSKAIAAFEYTDFDSLEIDRKVNAKVRWDKFANGFYQIMKEVDRRHLSKILETPVLPPILLPEDCPPISIVTLLYNRKAFFDLACHNMLITDYPKDKIEWIIVEDSDDPMEDASDKVVQASEVSAPLEIVYVPLKKKMPVAAKRNAGVSRAKNDIILMMDDDDQYPATSFRRRVAWLTKTPNAQCVGATTIACYDLVRGISAVNVPPMDIPLGQRVSEATLAFQKSWWKERPFQEDVQIGEGESFVNGREEFFVEIPPQQILVALSHKKNASSRRIPSEADVKPGCFWGFPREFLVFLHGLAGVKVVEEETPTTTS